MKGSGRCFFDRRDQTTCTMFGQCFFLRGFIPRPFEEILFRPANGSYCTLRSGEISFNLSCGPGQASLPSFATTCEFMDLKLFYSSPETDADLFYFGGFRAPDPFLAFEADGVRSAVLSPLEMDRGLREGRFDEVLSLDEVKRQCGTSDSLADQILFLAKERNATRLLLPEDFPARLAFELKEKSDYEVVFGQRPFCPERIRKSADEQGMIRRVNEVVSSSFALVEEILGSSSIVRDGLEFEGERLTSEFLQRQIAVNCLAQGCIAEATIVAGGDQACDPHERGSGPLRANELIIVDIFPRDEKTGYHGDMTRTYCKGKAPNQAVRLWGAVRDAQQIALERISAGVDGKSVHGEVTKYFENQGFETKRTEQGYQGFFHGTGHGLGLEIHEEPRLSRISSILKAGMVTTVEPGLYYRGIGGCRIEDVVAVTDSGVEMLSSHPLDWEIA